MNASHDPGKLVVTRQIINASGSLYGIVYLQLDYNAVFGALFDHPFNGDGQLYLIDGADRVIASSEPGSDRQAGGPVLSGALAGSR